VSLGYFLASQFHLHQALGTMILLNFLSSLLSLTCHGCFKGIFLVRHQRDTFF
jgi:hypothetical protein